jgi:lysyl-tRNA synthetase class 2
MLSKSVVVPSNETREKKQVELEDDENGCFFMQANENQMEFGLLKIKSELSGKNGTKP